VPARLDGAGSGGDSQHIPPPESPHDAQLTRLVFRLRSPVHPSGGSGRARRLRTAGRPGEAQYRPHHGGRPRLRSSGILRAGPHPHAEHRSPRGGGRAVHPVLRRLDGLRSFAQRAHDREAYGPDLGPGEHRGNPAPPGGRHPRRSAAGRRVRHRDLRQVGAGRPRDDGGALRTGFRRVRRLSPPGARPLLLPGWSCRGTRGMRGSPTRTTW
jgi:hypothetical protein